MMRPSSPRNSENIQRNGNEIDISAGVPIHFTPPDLN